MKILKLQEFVKLPDGVLYTRIYEDNLTLGLCVRGQVISTTDDGPNGPADFYYQQLNPHVENEELICMDDLWTRWGEFDYEATFAVLDQTELIKLTDFIGRAYLAATAKRSPAVQRQSDAEHDDKAKG